MVAFIRQRKKLLFVAGDIAAILLANLFAVALRFDFDWTVFSVRRHRNLEFLFIDLLVTPACFFMTGLYQGYWKYAGLDDLVRLVRAVAYRSVGLIVIFYILGFYGLSRAVIIMNTVLLLLMAGTLRLVPRMHFEVFSARRRPQGRRTLIIGAGDTGAALLRELKSPHMDYDPIGFIDDDREKVGAKIHGVPVLGGRSQLESLIQRHGASEVIIAIPGATGQDMRAIFDVCRRMDARFRTVPTRGELARGAARISQIRLVDVDDLLGRDVVRLDQEILREGLRGRRVLVTGAAGSIGREMARQVAAYEPAQLILVDRNENNLFYLEAELRERFPVASLQIVVGDITDRRRVAALFAEAKPHLVFHAAAYKHVPLMEGNPGEAIKNNVIGTRCLVEAAAAHGVDRFIYISTDKAVRPTSVMGATKRLGERLVKSVASGATRFMAVRFGNVLGSDGSVVPTFRRQIAAGGPVTVTHPEASRYFMTVPEAVQLVLMAGAMGGGAEIFLLRMGQPVRIADLARNMIELSGLKLDQDIKLVYTGLRPGEKLHEELKSDDEQALPTSNDQIMILSGIEPLNAEEWRWLDELEESALEGRHEAALRLLSRLVPDYITARPPLREAPASLPRVVEIEAKRRADAQA